MKFAQKLRYEVALRVIGQDLAALLIDSLEIIVEGDDFVVNGIRIAYAAEIPREHKKTLWRKMLSIGRPSAEIRHKSIRESFGRRYTLEDIKRLDETAKSRRNDTAKIQDVLTLAASLRTIGRMVDSGSGRLIKLVKNQDTFALEYEDSNGVPHKDEHSALSLHRSQQTGVALRDTKEKDPWSGADR